MADSFKEIDKTLKSIDRHLDKIADALKALNNNYVLVHGGDDDGNAGDRSDSSSPG
jgi:hypothetical protein